MELHPRKRLTLRSALAVLLVAPLLALALLAVTRDSAPAAAADEFRVVSGTYAGTGTAQQISVGFQPDLVIVKRSTDTNGYMRSTTMTASKSLGNGSGAIANVITSLDSTGFSVGTNAGANRNGGTYYWTAFKAVPGVMVAGTFTGNGGTQSIATPFRPALVLVANGHGGRDVTLRFADQAGDASVFAPDARAAPDHVTALGATGFTVGSANPVNESGEVLHYVAWADVPGQVSAGSYAGTGADEATITGLGFPPQALLVRGGSASSNRELVYKSSAMPAADALAVSGRLAADLVTALGDDGFSVGDDNNVNRAPEVYHFAAFRDGAQPPRVVKVESLTANGAYGAGSQIEIAVTFDHLVSVTGTPTLALATGAAPAVATYDGGSGSATLTFRYTVSDGDNAAPLAYTGADALTGGTIVVLTGPTVAPAGPAAINTLPDPGAPGSLSANAAVVIDTSSPVAPAAPRLDAASDTGVSDSDGITRITTPTFTGSAEPLTTLELSVDAFVVGTTPVDGAGAWSLALPASAPLAPGRHAVTAVARDAAGNASAPSASLSVLVDTQSPAAPSTPILDAASNSGGSSAPVVTNVNTPTVSGTGPAGATVELMSGPLAVGTTVAGNDGRWVLTVLAADALADGVHQLTAVALDVAGNASPPSPALTIDVDTQPPAAPTGTGLAAQSRTGPTGSVTA